MNTLQKVVLIRHGQTPCTVEGRFCGSHEPELTPAGLEMAERIARHPRMDGLEAVVTSPSIRARQTAEAIADVHGLPVLVDERLRELSFGQWEDLVPADVHTTNEFRRWTNNPALYCPPGGETGLEVMARAVAAIRDLTGQRFAVVAHKASIRLILSFYLGWPPARYRDIGNVTVGSISQLGFRPHGAELQAMGDVSHLPEEWRLDPDHAQQLKIMTTTAAEG